MEQDGWKVLLEELCNLPGVSGAEDPVRDRLREEILPWADHVVKDPLGNLTAVAGAGNPCRVGVYAHMDEVGMIVRRVSPTGLLCFDLVGSVDERILPGSEVDVIPWGGEPVRGVIGNKSRHLQSAEDMKGSLPYTAMAVDVGAASGEEAGRMGIEVGNPIVFPTRFRVLPTGAVLGKALDDRIGCAVLAEAFRRLHGRLRRVELHGIFTCQEEIGARGARTAGFGRDLRLCVTLDTVPVQNREKSLPGEVELGRGPVVRLRDWYPSAKMGMCSHPLITRRLFQVAEEEGIPVQRDVLTGTYLDSANAHLTGGGIPGGSICFPRRYSHTAVEMAHLEDIQWSVQLLCAFLLSLDREELVFEERYK